MINESCRKAFEKYFSGTPFFDRHRYFPKEYNNIEIQRDWQTWEAAYNIRPVLSVEEIITVLDNAGVKISKLSKAAQAIFDAMEAKQ
jgi:hypothetical protein